MSAILFLSSTKYAARLATGDDSLDAASTALHRSINGRMRLCAFKTITAATLKASYSSAHDCRIELSRAGVGCWLMAATTPSGAACADVDIVFSDGLHHHIKARFATTASLLGRDTLQRKTAMLSDFSEVFTAVPRRKPSESPGVAQLLSLQQLKCRVRSRCLHAVICIDTIERTSSPLYAAAPRRHICVA